MKKIVLSCSLSLLLAFSFVSIAMAAASTESITLNVNGLKIPNETVIINQTTMVPIRDVSLIPIFSVNWENKSKKVSVTNKKTNESLLLTMNNKVGYKGKTKVTLSVAPQNINGSIYVPLRFIGENLDAYVYWDSKTKTAVIYNSPVGGADESLNIVKGRNAVLLLTRINLQDHFVTNSESHITEYFFPLNKTQQFFIVDGDIAKYYEVRNHAAWEVWEGVTSDGVKGDKDVIPNIVHAVSKEWGQRPSFNGEFAYFIDQWMANIVNFGTIDETGTRNESGSFTRTDNSKPFIVAIEGENRTN
ncbi:copper amine oxidase N-terminal domain-containing protein [Paenibacillus rhizovicinus]|uniref:Copper amine oxidase N-terminal domain-containing protein n=1 Tax=Paenibacillus rhizovicinus TaxID=2704463 RepID=A0A6C0NTP8_9BACL|nr:copper amine oxidase N-terminal domain-containing protein [Paenibacillus rhizovicinus]QHW29491.1 copper amine oxidase N-terminal domain-containing protein [Paenibacillus rhizovicinus]